MSAFKPITDNHRVIVFDLLVYYFMCYDMTVREIDAKVFVKGHRIFNIENVSKIIKDMVKEKRAVVTCRRRCEVSLATANAYRFLPIKIKEVA